MVDAARELTAQLETDGFCPPGSMFFKDCRWGVGNLLHDFLLVDEDDTIAEATEVQLHVQHDIRDPSDGHSISEALYESFATWERWYQQHHEAIRAASIDSLGAGLVRAILNLDPDHAGSVDLSRIVPRFEQLHNNWLICHVKLADGIYSTPLPLGDVRVQQLWRTSIHDLYDLLYAGSRPIAAGGVQQQSLVNALEQLHLA